MKTPLPIDEFLPQIKTCLSRVSNLIIVASPGAGKTTRVPPALLNLTSKKILMLQPRRIAARASAMRMAEENQWVLGQEVGYRVRFEDCTSEKTQILVVTEALLMKELLRDPELSDYGIIILDEFHERNLNSDCGLAALKELQYLNRTDLKIIIMSATIDAKPLNEYLNPSEIIHVPGRTFPVDIHYDLKSQSLNTDKNFIERVVQKVISVLPTTNPHRHILVFLPGLSEIQRVQESLQNRITTLGNRKVNSLHGSLPLHEQQNVLQSFPPKIILATNVAETSVTIDGVDTVIDSGLARELQYDQRRLFPWLKTTRISRASAEQRKGRAGRQFPGRCFRLWTKLDENSMPPFSSPDILTQDLNEVLLTLIQMGVSDAHTFSWFESPPKINVERANQFLLQLGVIDINNQGLCNITEKGRWIQKLPLPPRLACLVYEGLKQNQLTLASQMASLLNERDPWGRENLESWQSSAKDSDLIPRLTSINQTPSTVPEFQTIEKSAKQICRVLGVSYNKISQISDNTIEKLLITTFSDRIARRRRLGENSALVVGQKGVELTTKSLVQKSEFFFCLSGHANESNGNAMVDLAHPLSKNLIQDKFSEEISIKKQTQYQEEKDLWMSVEQKYFKDLPLEEPILKPLKISSETILEIAKKSFSIWKEQIPVLQQWYLRMALAKELWPDENWLSLSQWEEQAIEMASMGESSLQTIKEKNWPDFFLMSIGQKEKNLFLKELPDKLQTPKGTTRWLSYESGGLVNLELKIQEAFGWNQTPRIAEGKIKIRLILLGPHLRPLQTTDDLASFWKGTYQELRPQLKAKYHRHQWPEDPTKLSES